MIVALGFASWVYVIAGASERHISPSYARVARWLAGFSYTLYLIHFPIVFFLRARVHGAVWQPTFIHLVYAALICAIAVGAAYLLSQFTEAKTELVRHRVMGLFQ
jgi:peptidoglycan/LPS O-acetylase OafA/YrhL